MYVVTLVNALLFFFAVFVAADGVFRTYVAYMRIVDKHFINKKPSLLTFSFINGD